MVEQQPPKAPPLSGGVYNKDYGKVLPAMTGQADYLGTTLYVDTAPGHIVGQGIEGPVENFSSDPPRFSKASGMIKTADTFTITKLWDARGQEVDPVAPILVPTRPKSK